MKRTTRAKYAAAALAGTAVLAACGTGSDSGSSSVPDGSATDIAGIRWVPQKVTVDGKDYVLPKGEQFRVDEAYVTFKPGAADPDVGGGDSGGTVGCNSFGADVEINGDTVQVSDIASTMMGCPGPVQEFEERFISVFRGTLKAVVEERDGSKTLRLTSGKGDSITLGEGSEETARR